MSNENTPDSQSRAEALNNFEGLLDSFPQLKELNEQSIAEPSFAQTTACDSQPPKESPETIPAGAKAVWHKPLRLEIRYTGNLLGNLEKLPYLATLIKRERAKFPDMLLLDTGCFSGEKNPGPHLGRPQVEVMNHLGFDATVPGAAEVSNSGALRGMARLAKFPFLASNWKGLGEGDYFQRWTVIERGGINIILLGLACPKPPEGTEVVSAQDAIKEVLELVEQQQDTSDSILIVLSQLEDGISRAIAMQPQPTKLVFEGLPYPGFDQVTTVSGGLLVPCVPNADSFGSLGIDLSGSVEPKK